jgi:CTD kinase subunit beta
MCIQDVALAALYVSTKMHDTLKKPRELLAVSYAVRFPEFAAKSKHPAGEVDLDTMDAQVLSASCVLFYLSFFDSFNDVDG